MAEKSARPGKLRHLPFTTEVVHTAVDNACHCFAHAHSDSYAYSPLPLEFEYEYECRGAEYE